MAQLGTTSGAGINADTLDSLDSSQFLKSDANDTMTGKLILDPASGTALSTGIGDDVDLGGNLLMGGSIFVHDGTGGSTAIGHQALSSPTLGNWSTAVGYRALAASYGNGNTAVGNQAMPNSTIAAYNVAVGLHSLQNKDTGGFNVAIGREALALNTDGAHNIGIGDAAGAFRSVGSYNIDIGHVGTDGSYTIRLGTPGQHTATHIAGIHGTSVSGSLVAVDSNGKLGTTSGSGIDADTVDGQHAADFMPASTDNWVNEAGDTMTGDLSMGGNLISGIGAGGAAFTANGGLGLAHDLPLAHGETISNPSTKVIRFSDGSGDFDVDFTGGVALKADPVSGALEILVAAGGGNESGVPIQITAGEGSGTGSGGDVSLTPGARGTLGADGVINLDGPVVIHEYTDTTQSTVLCVVEADDPTLAKRLGVCTDQPDVGGVCTCAAL